MSLFRQTEMGKKHKNISKNKLLELGVLQNAT